LEKLREGIQFLHQPELLSLLPIVFGAAILKVKHPDNIITVKTRQPGGGEHGKASKVTTEKADYLFLPTNSRTDLTLNTGDIFQVRDTGVYKGSLQINHGGNIVHQTREVTEKPMPIPNWSTLADLYMGTINNDQAFAAFMSALRSLD
jgi:hypothetical protein